MNPTELLALGLLCGAVLGCLGGYCAGWHAKRFDAERKLEAEAAIDREIAKEIDSIESMPVSPDEISPKDWLPTGAELNKLLEDD